MKVVNRKNQVVGLIIICTCAANAVANDRDSVPNNIQDEIRKIISEKNADDVSKNMSMLLNFVHNGNKIYAEGGSGTGNKDFFKFSNNSTNVKPNRKIEVHQMHKYDGDINYLYHDVNNKSDSSFANQTADNVFEKRKGKNFSRMLGLDDVAQANGTSSIKPRKGVNYYKDDSEDSFTDDVTLNTSCFVTDKNKCYDVGNYQHLNCSCCEMGNDLGEKVIKQPLVNCSICLTVNKVTLDAAKACNHICCHNNSANVTEQHIDVTGKHIDVNESKTVSKSQLTKNQNVENNSNLLVNRSDSVLNVTRPLKKLKPNMTSVPYDLDNASNLFSKSKGEKYVPKVISIFILPLIGILIYVLWKKMREFWDRRYYKRMDFLIDGIYND